MAEGSRAFALCEQCEMHPIYYEPVLFDIGPNP